MRGQARQWRFGAAGLANTAFGLGVIFVARATGAGELAANAIGYLCGWALSFAINRHWVFADQAPISALTPLRFAVVALLAWAANAMVVLALLGAGVSAPLAHVLGVPVNAVLVYWGCARWVFRPPRHPPEKAPP